MLLCLPNSTNATLFCTNFVPKCALKKFQSVQNAAARLITCSRKYDHITPMLKELHWLPVSECIKSKIMLLTFKALHQQSPVYIQDLVMYYQPSEFSDHLFLLVPTNFNLKSYGSRALLFPLLNSGTVCLSVFIPLCDNLSSFKKTYYC